jgi:acetyl esterase/lipase
MRLRRRARSASYGGHASFVSILLVAAVALAALVANGIDRFSLGGSQQASAQVATPTLTPTETATPTPTITSSPTAGGLLYKDELFPDVEVIRDVAYGQAVDANGQLQTLYLDLYQPVGNEELSRPALIWVHGGFFQGGDKAAEWDAEMATRFAQRGWVTASINYRIRDYVDMYSWAPAAEDAQHDAQSAVRWLRANSDYYRIDPDRIAISGFSAGAVTALHVHYNSSDPGDSGNPGYASDTAACVDISGWMNTSLMETGEPPALVIHGEEDTWVAFDAASEIVERASEVGVPVGFHPLEEATHYVTLWYKEDIILWMANFLYSKLIGPLPENVDTDSDGASDAIDNCPTLANPDQADTDGGGMGDACDPDDDHDGVLDAEDNCPLVPNPEQVNSDSRRAAGSRIASGWASNPAGDELGDACDTDNDNDGLPDSREYVDHCPYRFVADSDGDGQTDGFEAEWATDPCDPASEAACTRTMDSDNDGLINCIEHSGYNTCAAAGDAIPGWSACADGTDSDGDGCADVLEVMDINGDRKLSLSDRTLMAKRSASLLPASDSDSVFDVNKDGRISIGDQTLMAKNTCLLKPGLIGCEGDQVCPAE